MARNLAFAFHISIVDCAMEKVKTSGMSTSSPATFKYTRTKAPSDKWPDKKNTALAKSTIGTPIRIKMGTCGEENKEVVADINGEGSFSPSGRPLFFSSISFRVYQSVSVSHVRSSGFRLIFFIISSLCIFKFSTIIFYFIHKNTFLKK